MDTRTTSRPRERLLAAAKELTYRQGVGVGVDAILKEAKVARRSLYEHFGGKDGLIAEVLRLTTAEDEELYRQTMQTAGDDPRARLLAIFDMLVHTLGWSVERYERWLADRLIDLLLGDR